MAQVLIPNDGSSTSGKVTIEIRLTNASLNTDYVNVLRNNVLIGVAARVSSRLFTFVDLSVSSVQGLVTYTATLITEDVDTSSEGYRVNFTHSLSVSALYSSVVAFGTPNGGGGIIYNPIRDEIWNAMGGVFGDVGFTRIDPSTGNTLGKVVAVGATDIEAELGYPRYDDVNKRIYVGGYGPDSILVFDAITATFLFRILTPNRQWFGVHPTTGNIWTTFWASPIMSLKEISPAGVVLNSYPVPVNDISEILFDNNGDAWFTSGSGLKKFSPSTEAFTDYIDLITSYNPGKIFANTGVGSAVASTKWRINVSETVQGLNVWLSEIEFREVVGIVQPFAGGTATASSTTSSTGFEPVKLTDRDFGSLSSRWMSGPTANVAWWQYEFATPKLIAEYVVTGANEGGAPKNFTLEYWDGSTWVVSDTRTNQTNWDNGIVVNHFTYDPIRNSIWFSSTGAYDAHPTVVEFNLDTLSIGHKVYAKTTGFGFAPDVLYDKYRDLIWAFHNSEETCTAIDPSTGEIKAIIDEPTDRYPYYVAIAKNGVWINDSSWDKVERILADYEPVLATEAPLYTANTKETAHVVTQINGLLSIWDDIWYAWTPAVSGLVVLTTVDGRTTFPNILTLYSADGTTVLETASGGVDTSYSTVSHVVAANTLYYIRIERTNHGGVARLTAIF